MRALFLLFYNRISSTRNAAHDITRHRTLTKVRALEGRLRANAEKADMLPYVTIIKYTGHAEHLRTRRVSERRASGGTRRDRDSRLSMLSVP